jgi:predicted glycoside hydrolase/deacetylase ChbG (UPF0249 family)
VVVHPEEVRQEEVCQVEEVIIRISGLSREHLEEEHQREEEVRDIEQGVRRQGEEEDLMLLKDIGAKQTSRQVEAVHVIVYLRSSSLDSLMIVLMTVLTIVLMIVLFDNVTP